MTLVNHPSGNYSFVPGIAPYSCGVIANTGFEVVHVTLATPCPWREGFDLIDAQLAGAGRSRSALCAVSLRSPSPFTFDGFAQFNSGYADVLKSWGIFVDGVNPVARTNVAPESIAPEQPSLYGFAYTRPCIHSQAASFVVAGAGELPEGVLNREGIVRLADISNSGLLEKAAFVMDLMSNRLAQLGVSWNNVTRTNIYTVHPIDEIVRAVIVPRTGQAGLRGFTWFYSRPPIQEIEYEMDVRGVTQDIVLN